MKAVTDNAQTSKPGPTSFTDGSRECRNANAFIQEIRKEQGSGFGFIPFVGAGFSAASGIPLISQMNEYLRRCIFLALGINPGTSKDVREPWNPRTDSWPPLIDPLHRQKGYYQQEIYRALKNLKDQDSQDSAIYQEAFGAMAEWRTALSFLSRLIRENSSDHVDTRRSLKLSLGTPKQEVIDACFRHVTRDKSPSVTHTMLAVLSSYLRIDLMLTTNFDDLLERAFWTNQDNLQVFEVHLGDRLPQWSNIDRERTLVKLHGSRHSLRADYTLDDSPPLDDLRCFLEYLLRRRVSERQISNGSAVARHEVRNHLLVTGMSPREKRTKEFIRYAAAHTTNLIVFWVCYSAEDLKKVKEFALECWGPGQRDNTGCFVLHHTDPGMLLFHLAQSARNTLPPYGTVFPSVTRIPFPPLPARNLFNNSADSDGVRAKKLANSVKFRAKMEKNIQQCIGEVNKRRTRRLVVATGPRLVHGITSACAEVFKHFAQWNRCLWIDMNDIDSADNLFEVVIETAYLSLGLEHWTPVYMERDGRPRSVEMKLLTEFTDQEWIIFLNAREEPGSNRTSKENYPSNCSNGWIDRRLQRRGSSKWEDTSDSLQQFKNVIRVLCGKDTPRVSVVLICNDVQSPVVTALTQGQPPFTELLVSYPNNRKEGGNKTLHRHTKATQIADKVVHWTSLGSDLETRQRQRFVQTIVSFQRSRLLATIWDSCVDLSHVSPPLSKTKEEWLNELEDIGLIRWKNGGFIWLHARYRDAVRDLLRLDSYVDQIATGLPRATVKILEIWKPVDHVTEINDGIASWYQKVFDCTGSPNAVFDAVDHLCLAARSLLSKARVNSSADACERLTMAASLLNANRFLVQTTGGAINNTRRLSLICEDLSENSVVWENGGDETSLVDAVISLQLVAVALMRAIARDVGEQGKSYEFHSQLRVRKLSRKILHFSQIESYKDRTKEAFHSLIPNSYAGQEAQKLWLNWWRWCATLAISSRLYAQAESALSKAFYSLKTNRLEFPSQKVEFLTAKDFRSIFSSDIKWDAAVEIEVLRLIENWADLALLREELRTRSQLINVEGSTFKTSVADVKQVINWAITMADKFRTLDSSSDAHMGARAIWCKARFLMHLSTISLSEQAQREVIPHAMGLLDDAHACLTASDSSRNRSALAFVEIYRANIRLQQSSQASVGNRSSSFEQWCLLFLQKNGFRGSIANGLNLRVREVSHNPHQLRDIRTKAADAIRFLDRAEPILRERRRNVWWTTWYFERRLMAIALTIWSSVADTNEPIPFLGLESAISRANTEADQLLNDAIRMIRVDSHRLAEVILAYALCVRGLEVKLIVDKSAIALPNRIIAMKDHLEAALTELSNTESRLDAAVKSASQQSDKSVRRFVRKVQRLAKNVLAS